MENNPIQNKLNKKIMNASKTRMKLTCNVCELRGGYCMNLYYNIRKTCISAKNVNTETIQYKGKMF